MRVLVLDPTFRLLLGICLMGLATLVWGAWVVRSAARFDKAKLEGPTTAQVQPIHVSYTWQPSSVYQGLTAQEKRLIKVYGMRGYGVVKALRYKKLQQDAK